MRIYRSDDPIRDFNRYEADRDKWLAERPECADCGEHIQDAKAYYINGEWICKRCMSTYFVEVGDYME